MHGPCVRATDPHRCDVATQRAARVSSLHCMHSVTVTDRSSRLSGLSYTGYSLTDSLLHNSSHSEIPHGTYFLRCRYLQVIEDIEENMLNYDRLQQVATECLLVMGDGCIAPSGSSSGGDSNERNAPCATRTYTD
jgi:hypothetical protein